MDAERQVHTLKGVAGNVGAIDLHRAVQELDSAMRLGDMGKAGLLLRDVERELSAVIHGLEPLVQQAEAARAEAETPGPRLGRVVDGAALERALRTLAEFVRKSDPEAENALEQVRVALKVLAPVVVTSRCARISPGRSPIRGRSPRAFPRRRRLRPGRDVSRPRRRTTQAAPAGALAVPGAGDPRCGIPMKGNGHARNAGFRDLPKWGFVLGNESTRSPCE